MRQDFQPDSHQSCDSADDRMVTVTLPSWLQDDEETPPLRQAPRDFRMADLTSMVDVVLLLVIFFMIMAAVRLQLRTNAKSVATPDNVHPDAVEVPLERATPDDDPDDENRNWVAAQIFRDNNYGLDEYRDVIRIDYGRWGSLAHDQIVSELRQARQDVNSSRLRLYIEPDTRHELRVAVLDAAAEAGFTKVDTHIEYMW